MNIEDLIWKVQMLNAEGIIEEDLAKKIINLADKDKLKDPIKRVGGFYCPVCGWDIPPRIWNGFNRFCEGCGQNLRW